VPCRYLVQKRAGANVKQLPAGGRVFFPRPPVTCTICVHNWTKRAVAARCRDSGLRQNVVDGQVLYSGVWNPARRGNSRARPQLRPILADYDTWWNKGFREFAYDRGHLGKRGKRIQQFLGTDSVDPNQAML